jgi:hypothetical protein
MVNANDFDGTPLSTWSSAFPAGMSEYAATTFFFSREAAEQVRIAFGNSGPVIDGNGTRSPVYTHAVTLTPHIAVELARQLLKYYASPFTEQASNSAPC